MNKRLLITLAIAATLITGTYIAIKYAKGYRPSRTGIKGTGLLAANSLPQAAQVFINGKLTTATNDTLNLPPGEYEVEIKKEGYLPWKKHLIIQAELVTATNTQLFPSVPSLTPLTFSGAENLTPSPDGQKIAYAVATASASLNKGLYLLELNNSPLPGGSREPRQIARPTTTLDFSQATLTWSPDSRQLLVSSINANILLDVSRFNDPADFRDVTARLPLIFQEWEEMITLREKDRLRELPLFMQQLATASATNVYFSPDNQKMLYTATEPVTIPKNLVPPLPASNTQPEKRRLEPGETYVYDLEEDKNFLILPALPAEIQTPPKAEKLLLTNGLEPIQEATASSFTQLSKNKTKPEILNAFKIQYSSTLVGNLQWFPTSKHLIKLADQKISIFEYDGTNDTTVYAAPFEDDFVYPWPNGSRLIILTNLNPQANLPANLYALDLK